MKIADFFDIMLFGAFIGGSIWAAIFTIIISSKVQKLLDDIEKNNPTLYNIIINKYIYNRIISHYKTVCFAFDKQIELDNHDNNYLTELKSLIRRLYLKTFYIILCVWGIWLLIFILDAYV